MGIFLVSNCILAFNLYRCDSLVQTVVFVYKDDWYARMFVLTIVQFDKCPPRNIVINFVLFVTNDVGIMVN